MYIYLLTYLLADADVTQLSIWVVSSLCMEFATTSLQQPHESEQICQQRSWVALCPWRERTCWSSWASSEFSTHCGHRRNATWQLSLVGVGGATLISAKPVMKLSALSVHTAVLFFNLSCLACQESMSKHSVLTKIWLRFELQKAVDLYWEFTSLF